ncbi:MAG: hypothetical protein IJV40_14115 [Oscillospiraceae bacterium]|nr:hypothetical protein [Oscillospiraceae bacterium]
MKFNRDYLIRRDLPAAKELGIKAYSYKACSIMESREELDGVMTHVISLRKKDCSRYLSKEELYGILDTLGMRRDGTLTVNEAASGHAIYFMQPAA